MWVQDSHSRANEKKIQLGIDLTAARHAIRFRLQPFFVEVSD